MTFCSQARLLRSRSATEVWALLLGLARVSPCSNSVHDIVAHLPLLENILARVSSHKSLNLEDPIDNVRITEELAIMKESLFESVVCRVLLAQSVVQRVEPLVPLWSICGSPRGCTS